MLTVFMPTVPERKASRTLLERELQRCFQSVIIREQAAEEDYRQNLVLGLRSAVETEADWILRVDDDAVLCPEFPNRVISLVNEYRPPVMTLFSRSSSDLRDLKAGLKVNRARYVHGVCLLLDSETAWDFAGFLEGDGDWDGRSGRAFRRFWRGSGSILNSLPSLANQRPDVASVLRHGASSRRQSPTFLSVFGATC